MTHDNDPFADAARQVLADHCTPQAVRAIEAGGRGAPAAAALWQQLQDAGLADALAPEGRGGAGLTLLQAFGVLAQCGAHALPLPLAETMLARAVLARAGLAAPPGSIALARGRPHAGGGLHCAQVGAGALADAVLVQLEQSERWVLLDARAAQAGPQAQPLDAALTWSAAQVQAGAAVALPAGTDVAVLHAALLAAQMAGALETVLGRSLQFANDRQQFGRPIGKFQAIQHQLAVLGEHVFAARMAAQLGCAGAADGLWPHPLRVASAKARCSEAALEAAQAAHAIHGAIGFTEECDLQLFTRRLHAWRQCAGSEGYWQRAAGAALLEHGGLALDLVRSISDAQELSKQ